jgi:hypothetical protein
MNERMNCLQFRFLIMGSPERIMITCVPFGKSQHEMYFNTSVKDEEIPGS